ncbi:MAG: hypothetical protein CMM87_00695 [Rickettsiales bacterium]|nr:hypothetical protein [Rickettsiales bacterium]|tara:strand:- start:49374 stop:51080 length:1707 start_codon:yes stop_codon:yes gene_type:complete
MHSHFLKDSLVIIFLSFLLFYIGAPQRPFSTPDEGRYMEIPREMAANNSFITPRLNGVKYFEKPPLLYWLQAGMIKAFGAHEWSGRIIPALAGALGVFFAYFLALNLFNRPTALLAAIILSTSALYFILSHIIITDGLFSTLVNGALSFFIVGMHKRPGERRRRMAILAAACLALAVLTKGLVACILFSAISLIWFMLCRKKIRLLPLYIPLTLSIFLLIVMPWHILVQLKNPEFFDFYIIKEHFQRFATKTHNRYQPFYFFLPVIIFGLFPWFGALITGLIRSILNKELIKKDHKCTIVFLLVWSIFPTLLFSISSSKLITYVLPVITPLSVLIAYSIKRTKDLNLSYKPEVLSYSVFFICVLIFYEFKKSDIPINDFLEYHDKIQFLKILFWLSVLLPLPLYKLKGSKITLYIILTLTVLQYSVMVWATLYNDSSSVKSTYKHIEKNIGAHKIHLISYYHYHQDLPVYAQRLIPIVGGLGEMEFGHQQEQHPIKLSDADFWQLWFSDQYVCAFAWKQQGYNKFKKSLSLKQKHFKPLRDEQINPYEVRIRTKLPTFCNVSPLAMHS